MEETMSAAEYRRMMGLDGPGDDEKTARNALRGRKAQVVGQSFQNRLNDYHALLLQEDYFLYIVETLPPMRPVTQGRGKAPLYALLGTGPVDYVFAMTNGLSGAFDAKSTEQQKYFSWPRKRLHQLGLLRDINRVSEGTAPAFALVEWRAHDEVRLHPVGMIKDDNIVRREHGVYVPLWVDFPAWETVVVRLWEVEQLRDKLTALLESGQHDGEADPLDEQLGFKWLTSREAQDLIRRERGEEVPISSITHACRAGHIRGAVKAGRDWRFNQMRFLGWYKNRPKPGPKPTE